MKLVILLGKGGVGKSTCSSALAHQLAKKNQATLLASFDPAHNLGDIFGENFTGKIKKFSDNLAVLEVDTQKSADAYIAKTKELMQQVYSYTTVYNVDKYFNLFRYLPGMQEFASVSALLQLLQKESANYENIVIDTPPTGLALRVLALASISLKWLHQLKKLREKILERRHAITAISQPENELRSRRAKTDDRVMQKIKNLIADYRWLEDLLKGDSTHCGIVLNLDELSLKESQRIKASLREIGIELRFVLINKVADGQNERILCIKKKLLGKKTRCLELLERSDYQKFSEDLTKILQKKEKE